MEIMAQRLAVYQTADTVDNRQLSRHQAVVHRYRANQRMAVERPEILRDFQGNRPDIIHCFSKVDIDIAASQGIDPLQGIHVSRQGLAIGIGNGQADRNQFGIGVHQLIELHPDRCPRIEDCPGGGNDAGDRQIGSGSILYPLTGCQEDRPLVQGELGTVATGLPVDGLVPALAIVLENEILVCGSQGNLAVLHQHRDIVQLIRHRATIDGLDGVGRLVIEMIEDDQIQFPLPVEQDVQPITLPFNIHRLADYLVVAKDKGAVIERLIKLGVMDVEETDETAAKRIGHRHGQYSFISIEIRVRCPMTRDAEITEDMGMLKVTDIDNNQPIAAGGKIRHVLIGYQTGYRLIHAHLGQPDRPIPYADIVNLETAFYEETVIDARRLPAFHADKQGIPAGFHGACFHRRIIRQIDTPSGRHSIGEAADQDLFAGHTEINLVEIRIFHPRQHEAELAHVDDVIT
ncbi:MAG: hypothetical protein ACD_75C01325G0003 [uncultured bacterium]|nr:MAG: hypothetical protein ACD_75C01325G0003 [uncultured bacterium]